MIAKTSTIARSFCQTSAGTDNSVTESIREYSSRLAQSGKSDRTVSNVKKLLTAIVYEVMGCDGIDEFNADITMQFIEHQEEHGYAGKTIRTQLAELKRFSKWLVQSGRIKSDPIANLTFEVDEFESAARVQVRFQRLFKMIEFVSNSRFGVTLEMLNEACSEVSTVCLRTTRRDAYLLVSIGVFRKDRNPSFDLILFKANPLSKLSQLAGIPQG